MKMMAANIQSITSDNKAASVNYWMYMISAAGYLLAVAYGSLLPFEFNSFPATIAQWQILLTSPSWSTGPMDDTVLNLLIYMPFGLLLRLGLEHHFQKSVGRLIWRIVIPVLIVGTSVWMIECTQSLVTIRVASLNDWLLNTAGTGLAALLAPVVRQLIKYFVYVLSKSLSLVATIQRSKPWLPVFLTSAMIILLLAQIIVQWQRAIPVTFNQPDSVIHINWLPFLHHFMMPYGRAMVALLSESIWFSAMAGLICLVLLALRKPIKLSHVIGLTVSVTCISELLKTMDPHRYPDITTPLLAGMCAISVVFMMDKVIAAYRLGLNRN